MIWFRRVGRVTRLPSTTGGQVVGTAGLGKGMQAFLWQNGNRRDLNTLGARYSYAVAISERGQVAGRVIYKTAKRDVYHAFSWWNRPMVDLGTLGGKESEAAAVNERGQVVGFSMTGEPGATYATPPHVYLWTPDG